MFANGWKETFPTEILRVVKVTQRMPQPVYKILNLQALAIDGQFYNYELEKETLPTQTGFQIDKIVSTRNTGGIKHLVKYKAYGKTFKSWVNASDIKRM